MKKTIIYIQLLWLSSITISAQTGGGNPLEMAQKLFDSGKYESVLSLLKNTQLPEGKINEGILLRALVYYQLNDLNQAELLLKSLTENETAVFAEVWLYLGRIAHHKNEFDKATNFYKAYLKNIPTNHPHRKMVWEEIRRCSNGRMQQFLETSVFVENLGNKVNTPLDEFNPVESPLNEGILYFSAQKIENTGGKRNQEGIKDDIAGKLYSDMYRTSNEKGMWDSPNPMHFVLNSPLHEILLNFNFSGDAFYYYRGSNFSEGKVLKNNFIQAGLVPQDGIDIGIEFPIDAGEGGIQVFKDNIVLFAAKLPEGYGGWDIYMSVKIDNKWTKPKNLGPQINSEFDEVFPYLTPNESILFFSSNNSEYSVGGFDILKSKFDAQSDQWSKPETLGFPVNSAGDDIQFKMAKDGYTGYFASSRKESLGQRDLYVAYFSEQFNMEDSSLWSNKVQPVVIETSKPMLTKQPEEEKPAPVVSKEIKSESKQPTLIPLVSKEKKSEPIQSSPIPEVPPTPVKEIKQEPQEKLAPFILISSNQFNPSNQEIRWMDEQIKLVKNQISRKIIINLSIKTRSPLYEKFQETLKYAEEIYSLFKGKGLKEDQIRIRIITKNEIPDNKIELKTNIVDSEGLPVNLSQEGDPFSLDLANPLPFYYKISIPSSAELMSAALVNNHMYPITEKQGREAEAIYSIGQFKTFEEARLYADKLIKNGLKEIFIKPYVYDSPVSGEMLSQFVHLYPDFKIFLQQ